jgi:hypothetical protein
MSQRCNRIHDSETPPSPPTPFPLPHPNPIVTSPTQFNNAAKSIRRRQYRQSSSPGPSEGGSAGSSGARAGAKMIPRQHRDPGRSRAEPQAHRATQKRSSMPPPRPLAAHRHTMWSKSDAGKSVCAQLHTSSPLTDHESAAWRGCAQLQVQVRAQHIPSYSRQPHAGWAAWCHRQRQRVPRGWQWGRQRYFC